MSKSEQSPTDLSYIAPALRALATPITKIKPDPENARRHPEQNLDAIAESLRRFGQQKPIIVAAGGIAVAGNGVLLAAKQIGWTHVAVVRTNLKAAKVRAFALADNRTGELSEWDEQVLLAQLQQLKDADVDMDEFGFSADELAHLLTADITDGLTDPDEVPAPPDEAITQPGDLYVLGEHRLLCGDSGSVADVDRLLDGAKIHLVNTDPPYNVKVAPRSNNAVVTAKAAKKFTGQQGMDAKLRGKTRATTKKMRPKDRPLANDFVSDEEFASLLRAWFGNIRRVLEPGRGFYIWGGYSNIWNYPNALKEAELYFSQMVIWVKEHPVLTRKDFMGNHEWCFYGWREGAAHKYYGPANATDVWSIKKINPQSMVHLTEKPVDLAVRPMQYSSRPGENVLDLFGGSGSTMIAAEQTQRRAFLMELDTLYCDVIVKRWEEFTGKKAQLVQASTKSPKRRAGLATAKRSVARRVARAG